MSMQIKMIFATTLAPAEGETEPTELKVGATATVDDATGAALVEAGRAEPVKAAAKA